MPRYFNLNGNEFGHVYDVKVGTCWGTRREVANSHVHSMTQAGIYHRSDGARSIMLSGEYKDDEDYGDVIIYTGTGGRECRCPTEDSGKKMHIPGSCTVEHQTFSHPHNRGLKRNVGDYDKPVRVIRGDGARSLYAPISGYRYDGLYDVVLAWMDEGKDGFNICRYKLKRVPGQPPIPRAG